MSKVYVDLLETLKCSPGDHNWATSDDEETWDRHQADKATRKQLKKLGWTKDSITYRCDSLGFRNKFDLEKDQTYTLFMGDSFTFGVGLREQQIWTHHVKEFLDKPCYNAARSGYGIDSCYRTLKYLLNQGYKFDNVFLFSPSKSRVEIWDNFEKKWMTVAWWTHYKKDLITKLNHPYFSTINFDKTIDAIENLCTKNNITMFHLNTEECDDILFNDNTARDLQHAGPIAQEVIANNFIKLYDNNLQL